MELLSGVTRAYPWGSRTAIAQLRGEPASSAPEAELWFGAHPGGSSSINGEPLVDIIAADPVAALGERVVHQFGPRLPFLLKILAAAEPLSLQAHPSREQAIEGFQRENASGLALHAPTRNYKDDNHKPELLVALTEFEAMAGFRPLEQTSVLFDVLACPELEHYRAMLGTGGDEEAHLRALFTTWITIPAATRYRLIDALTTRAELYLSTATDYGWLEESCKNFLDLAQLYPGDVGLLGALLLNKVTLQPGEAIYLDAGQLHAYVRGTGVELMASSDNVLRGGLTSKYVDVPELVRVLDFHSLASIIQQPERHGAWQHYPVPTNEFALVSTVMQAGDELDCSLGDGPLIVLCTSGSLSARRGETTLSVAPTEAFWVRAGETGFMLAATQDNTRIFCATV